MNTQKTIEISPAIIEQINEGPVTYWRAGMTLVPGWTSNGIMGCYLSEQAAWIARQRCLASGRYTPSSSAPIEIGDRQAVNDFAVSIECHKVEVCDETQSIVDSWMVQ
jgi:hypothetical protein